MPKYGFLVTIDADDYETAKDELTGGLEDARDSGYIDDYEVEGVNNA